MTDVYKVCAWIDECVRNAPIAADTPSFEGEASTFRTASPLKEDVEINLRVGPPFVLRN